MYYGERTNEVRTAGFQNRIGKLLSHDSIFPSNSKPSGTPNILVRGSPRIFSGSIRKLCYGGRTDDLRSGQIRTVEYPCFTVQTAHPKSIRSGAVFLKLSRSGAERISASRKIHGLLRSGFHGLDCVTERGGFFEHGTERSGADIRL